MPINVAQLKSQYIIDINIVIKGIATIKSTANKSSCNSVGDSQIYIGKYDEGHECTMKVTNVLKAAMRSL